MEAVDTVWFVAEENGDDPETRLRTIPIYGPEFEWWSAAVKRELKAQGWKQKDLANALHAQESAVSRCIHRKAPTYELLLAISDALRIPYPVILPESEDEALYLAEQRRLKRRDIEARMIAAGVPSADGQRQPAAVTSQHEGPTKAKATPRKRRGAHAKQHP